MWRTFLLCAAFLWAAYVGAAWITHDFQVWTAEGARRLEVARRPVPVPGVLVQGPGVQARDLRDLLANGRDVTLVEFIYTRCQTVCLSLGTLFQQMQATLQTAPTGAASERVKLLSVSLDSVHDTLPVLASYAARMHADPRWWRFVRVPQTGDTQRLFDAVQVVVVPSGQGDFEHNAALLVVDRHGRLVRVFDLAQQQLALDYALHLAQRGMP